MQRSNMHPQQPEEETLPTVNIDPNVAKPDDFYARFPGDQAVCGCNISGDVNLKSAHSTVEFP